MAKPGEEEAPPKAEAENEEEGEEEGEANEGDAATNAAATATSTSKKKRSGKKKKRGGGGGSGGAVPIPAAYQGNLRVSAPSADVGRRGLAARDLPEGELVFEEEPVALVLFRRHVGGACLYCGRSMAAGGGKLLDGGNPCCSPACRDGARGQAFRLAKDALLLVEDVGKETGAGADLLRMVLLLACAQHLAASSEEDKRRWSAMEALVDHMDRMPPAFLASVRQGVERCWEHLPDEVTASVSVDAGVRLACAVNVNSHGCCSATHYNTTVGFGLFPLLAMLNHSCRPNCAYVFHDGKMGVRTLGPVKAGEELTVHYVNLLQGRAARQAELRETKHFSCGCPRCSREGPADVLLGGVCCAKCGERGLLLPKGENGVRGGGAMDDELLLMELEGGDGKGRGKGKGKGKGKAGGPSSKGIEEAVAALDVGKGEAEGEKEEEATRVCQLCHAAFPEADILAYLDRVEAGNLQGRILTNGKAFEQARTQLDTHLALHSASPGGGGSTTGAAAAGAKAAASSAVKKVTSNSPLRLHPGHYLLLDCLPFLVTCCKNLNDHSAAVAHLRRLVAAMTAVYPPNFPELGDYNHTLGSALYHYLCQSERLPPKTRAALLGEMKQAFAQARDVRRAAMGADHPLTQESQQMLDSMAAAAAAAGSGR